MKKTIIFLIFLISVATMTSCGIFKKAKMNPTYSTQERSFQKWSLYNFKRQTRKTW